MDDRTNVINLILANMQDDLTSKQLEKLQNILYIQLDSYEVQKRTTALDLIDTSAQSMLKKFIATKRLEGKSEKTLHQYNLLISKMLNTIKKKVEEITTYDLRFYLAEYQEQHGISNQSLENIRTCIVVFYNWLMDEKFISQNPASALKPIKCEKIVRKAFTANEMEQLRCACTCKRDRAIIEFLYSTGCRVSEAVSLDRTDIDFVEKQVIVMGKGGKQRIVYLDDVALMYLSDYLTSRTDNNTYLFCSRQGRLSISGVEKILKNIGKRAKVEDVHPHRFRRTLATEMIRRGAPIQDVSTILGHAQITTTQIYVEIDQQQVANTYNRCIA